LSENYKLTNMFFQLEKNEKIQYSFEEISLSRRMMLYILKILFTTYTFMLLARVFGSWFPNFAQSRLMRFIAFYTDPYLNIFRKIIPPLGMLDISPMIAFFALQLIRWVFIGILS
jgi:YggT family protein